MRRSVVALVERAWHRVGTRAAMVWMVTYLVVWGTGQRFDARYLGYGWQLIPWDILSSDPIRSVWYLHVQPPMWNLLLGSTAWLSPFGDAISLQAVMALIGLAGAWLAAELGQCLGFGRRASVIVALIATLNPEVLKGAFEPTYELAIGVLLLSSVFVLVRMTSMANTRRGVFLLAALVTTTTMTRSLYHPVWAAVLVAFGLWLLRGKVDRRTICATLAIPILVMGGWMLKNQLLFGEPTLSSWFGMNLQRAVIPVLPRDDLEAMRANGEVSEIAMIGPFEMYEKYADQVPKCEPKHSHRSLAEANRTTNEWSPNFNYECYLPVFALAGEDALAVIREHPGAWVEGRLWSLRVTFAVATGPAESDSVAMRFLDSVYSIARLDISSVLSTRGWGTPIYGDLEAATDFGLVLIPLYLLLILAGARVMYRRLRRRELSTNDIAFFASSFTIGFTIVVGAVAELGEQSRFRTMVDPLASVVGAALVVGLLRRVRHRWIRQRHASAVGR